MQNTLHFCKNLYLYYSFIKSYSLGALNMSAKRLTIIAILSAIAIITPLVIPSIPLPPPMTMTLSMHTTIWIAVFISPVSALCLSIASAVGFLIKGLPFVAVRAATHMIFAVLASIYLVKVAKPKTFFGHATFVSFFSLIHAICEVIVVWFFFMPANLATLNMSPMYYIFVVVGLVTFVHSIIDYIIALSIMKVVNIYDYRAKRKSE